KRGPTPFFGPADLDFFRVCGRRPFPGRAPAAPATLFKRARPCEDPYGETAGRARPPLPVSLRRPGGPDLATLPVAGASGRNPDREGPLRRSLRAVSCRRSPVGGAGRAHHRPVSMVDRRRSPAVVRR